MVLMFVAIGVAAGIFSGLIFGTWTGARVAHAIPAAWLKAGGQ